MINPFAQSLMIASRATPVAAGAVRPTSPAPVHLLRNVWRALTWAPLAR